MFDFLVIFGSPSQNRPRRVSGTQSAAGEDVVPEQEDEMEENRELICSLHMVNAVVTAWCCPAAATTTR